MKYWLLLVGRDWIRAPISGTAALVFHVLALNYLFLNQPVLALLLMILAQVLLLGRGSYRVKVVQPEVQAAISIARYATSQVTGERDYVLSREEAAAIRLVCNEAEHG